METALKVRRSARFADKEINSYTVDSEEEEEQISSNFEEDEKSDDEYQEVRGSSKKRVKQARKRSSRSTGPNRTSGAKRVQVQPGFEENSLYEALSNPNVSIEEMALEWLESYENEAAEATGGSNALTTLINFILRCCGSVSLLQPHDLANIDSASETVGELAIGFEKQKYHEFPFFSNNKSLKFFRNNVTSFFQHLISLAHEKLMLYRKESMDPEKVQDEDYGYSSQFMTSLFTWISTLSSSTVRPFRIVSTIIMLSIQTELCLVNRQIMDSLERYRRQIDSMKKGKNGKKVMGSEKYKIVSKNYEVSQVQVETLSEYFNEIIESIFIHRYRDVDPNIRLECIKSLGRWMVIYPDNFFQSSYLRYFGWLLSDPTNIVRIEVTKVLLKLYKASANDNQDMSLGFRQFTERFKAQLINMCSVDVDLNVRQNLVSIVCELLKIGFLDDEDKLEISIMFFKTVEQEAVFGASNEEKLKLELAKFISIINMQDADKAREKYSSLFYESVLKATKMQLDLDICLKVRCLIILFEKIQSTIDLNKQAGTKDSDFPLKYFALLFRYMYSLDLYANSYEDMFKYFLFDFSSLVFDTQNLEGPSEPAFQRGKDFLEISAPFEKYYMMSIILGASTNILDKKKKKSEGGNSDDSKSVFLAKCINYIQPLHAKSEKSYISFFLFVKFWSLLLSCSETENIYFTLRSMDQLALFDSTNKKIFRYFREFDGPLSVCEDFASTFSDFFSVFFGIGQNQGLNSQFMSDDSKILVQRIAQDLVSEIKEKLDEARLEESSKLESDILFGNLSSLVLPIVKLAKFADYVDPNDYLFDESAKTSKILSDLVCEVTNKFNCKNLIKEGQYLKFERIISILIKYIFELFLVANCWCLDDLIKQAPDVSEDIKQKNSAKFIFYAELVEKSIAYFDSFFEEGLNSVDFQQLIDNIQDRYDIFESINQLRTCMGSILIDILVSMKMFHVRSLTSSLYKTIGNRMADLKIMKYLNSHISPSTMKNLRTLFLIKEAKLGCLRKVELDRIDDDVSYSVIYEDYFDNVLHGEDATAEKEKQIKWNVEKDLCVYVVKLFMLPQVSLVNTDEMDRLRLNVANLNGLFKKIVDQNFSQLKAT